ncbi:MAG TPA: MBL fold metallo-hydrolase [Clostridiales bacterium]|nr:MBL fold metallo-hydrolase [Clostridiales bacterium]
MVKIFPLYSGSGGNCTLVQSDNANLLVDVGLGCRATLSALKMYNLSLSDITAIVVTHEHSDHIGGISSFVSHSPVPVYTPKAIADLVAKRATYCDVSGIADVTEIADLRVERYECSHDAAACYGYRFSDGTNSVATVTDTGCVTTGLVDFLAPCDRIQLESNHDVDMLKSGPYPYPLKRRILSDFGHLSNDQATQVLSDLVGSNVKSVILAHLSEHNNTAELAFNNVVNMYADKGLVEGRDISVYVAKQHDNTVIK